MFNRRALRWIPGLLIAGCAAGGPTSPAVPETVVADSASASSEGPLQERYAAVVRQIAEAAEQRQSFAELTALCTEFPHRLSGSSGLEGAVKWVQARLLAAGHDNVQLQPVEVPKWVRGAESLQLLPGGEPLAIIGLGGSVSTPAQGLSAEVLVVKSFEELKAKGQAVQGRIVFFDVRMSMDPKTGRPNYGQLVGYRRRGADAAAALGAKAMLIRSLTTDPLSPPHTGTLGYAGDAPKIPGAALSWADADRLLAAVAKGSTSVRLSLQNEDAGLAPSANVIAELQGAKSPEEIVVFGGHLDSWDVGQGAHDNGAGVVIAMEALSLLRELGLKPRRTLRLVLWTNEENGERGAAAYDAAFGKQLHVAALETDSGAAAIGGLALQTGAPGPNGFPMPQRMERLQELVALLGPLGVRQALPFFSGADLQPLIARGVPGIGMVHDLTHYFDVHHSEADRLETVDAESLKQSVAVTAATLFVLADMSETLGDTH